MSDQRVTLPRSRSTMHRIDTILDGRVQAFPADYRGVRFRSQLEADFAHYLDQQGISWEYEPEVFAGEDGKGYLPDFRVGTKYLEIKPTLAEVPEAQRRMESIWRTQPDATLVVVCAEGCRFCSATYGGEWSSWVERWRH